MFGFTILEVRTLIILINGGSAPTKAISNLSTAEGAIAF